MTLQWTSSSLFSLSAHRRHGRPRAFSRQRTANHLAKVAKPLATSPTFSCPIKDGHRSSSFFFLLLRRCRRSLCQRQNSSRTHHLHPIDHAVVFASLLRSSLTRSQLLAPPELPAPSFSAMAARHRRCMPLRRGQPPPWLLCVIQPHRSTLGESLMLFPSLSCLYRRWFVGVRAPSPVSPRARGQP